MGFRRPNPRTLKNTKRNAFKTKADQSLADWKLSSFQFEVNGDRLRAQIRKKTAQKEKERISHNKERGF
jgi:hypothetical protein